MLGDEFLLRRRSRRRGLGAGRIGGGEGQRHGGGEHEGLEHRSVSFGAGFAGGGVFAFGRRVVLDDALQPRQLGAIVQRDQGHALRGAAELADLADAGADMLMVKPALPNLDLIWRLREAQLAPICAYESKKHVLRFSFASEVDTLARALLGIASGRRLWRDLTVGGLADALRETIAP